MDSRFFALLVIFIFAVIGCSNEIEPPGGVASLPPQPEIPHGLTASIGDGTVTIAWMINNPSLVDRYAVYYSDSAAVDMSFLASTQSSTHTVTGLVNGRRYFFRVAAIDKSNLEGEKSRSVSAVPGVFSVSIENGAEYINKRDITVGLTAPQNTNLVQLSEDSGFGNAHWESFAANKNFELSDIDGLKYIYARFQLDAGGSSDGLVFDSINLDRVAVIDSVTVSYVYVADDIDSVLSAGDTVHFSLDPGETGGAASVEVDGLGEVSLNDAGERGDAAAGDGRYEVDFIIQIGTELADAEVTGRFTDAAGNQAPEIKATTRLNATSPPYPVRLSGYAVSSLELLLEWTRSEISDFSSYRLFRSESAGVGQNSYMVTMIENQGTLSYRDTGLAETTDYYYRLYVFDNYGNSDTGSNELSLQTLVNYPPDAVPIAVNLTGDSLTVEVSWLQADDDDFDSYRVYRDIDGIIDVPAIKIINSRNTVSFIDHVPAVDQYFYQVEVCDKQGECTGSEVVSINVPW